MEKVNSLRYNAWKGEKGEIRKKDWTGKSGKKNEKRERRKKISNLKKLKTLR